MWFVIVFAMRFCTFVIADEFNADMENTGVCTRSLPVIVRKQDVYNIYAEPRQDIPGTRDRCTVRFKSEQGQRFKLCIRDLKFRECQVYIKMYDGIPEADVLNNARYSFGCNSGTGNTYNSYTADVAISLEKPDSGSTGYKFYLRLTTEDGPDVCGEYVPQEKTDSMSVGVIVGIIVAAVLVLVVIIAVVVYLIYAYRRRQEEKESLAHSTLLHSSGAVHGGSSAHSSMHSSIHSSVHSSKHSMYPAFRTTLSEKHGTCNSVDTRSYDSDIVDKANNDTTKLNNDTTKLKPAIKNVKHEFESMRRGLQRENLKKKQEAEKYEYEEACRQEHQRADKLGRAEINRGLGRSKRTLKTEISLTDENIKYSLRQAREKGRLLDDRGSTRSTKTRNKSHSPSRSVQNYRYNHAASDNSHSDYNDHHRDRGRKRSRSVGSRPSQRSSSTGTHSRGKRNYDRDSHSDFDDERGRRRHDFRDRYSEDEYSSRRDSSRTHRSRTNNTGRRKR